jgi:uncharacterized membrane protein HdeD (DUF308 family)
MTEEGTLFQKYCSQVWWLVLLRGVAMLLLGGMLISQPGVTAIVMIQFLGAYFLLDGIVTIIKSIMGRRYVSGWGLGIVMGALETLTGLVIFGHPLASTIFTASVLVYSVAIMAIFFGALGIVTWIQLSRSMNDQVASLTGTAAGMLAGGVLAIILGVILIMNPLASAQIYLIVMGVMALICGLVQLIASFQIRQIGKKGLAALTS